MVATFDHDIICINKRETCLGSLHQLVSNKYVLFIDMLKVHRCEKCILVATEPAVWHTCNVSIKIITYVLTYLLACLLHGTESFLRS